MVKNKTSIEKQATLVSSFVALLLTLIKLVIGVISGSVAVLASAIDSIMDMFVSIFNYFAITNSEKPADENFNYGRGKVEALASVIEGTLITISGLYLLYKAAEKIYYSSASSFMGISIATMIISTIITFILVVYLEKVAKKTNNMVIKADSLHYKTDFYVNITVLVSLVLVYITKIELIDGIFGGLIAIYIIYSAYELIENGISMLLDKAVDKNIINQIKKNIVNEKTVNDYHLLKTRQAGNNIFIEVHLVYNCVMTLMEAHKSSNSIEHNIRKIDKNINWIINIHLDPYDDSHLDK